MQEKNMSYFIISENFIVNGLLMKNPALQIIGELATKEQAVWWVEQRHRKTGVHFIVIECPVVYRTAQLPESREG